MATLPTRSQLGRLTDPGAFVWATGIEDTFITAPWPATGRTLDEYALTGHYERWKSDIDLIAHLGVKAARYGVPWHRIEPERGRWDWDFADKTLEHLIAVGVEPIVDLVHYGLPPWLEGAFLNPDYAKRVAEYAARLAERFKGRIVWYTPLNEPRITAWYCGRLGWWPPFRRGWSGFVMLMLAIAEGIVETVQALHQVDPDIVPVHVDATDVYDAATPDLTDEAAHRQEIVFLALDLVSGRVDSAHALWPWLLRHGATEERLGWFQRHAVDLPLIGLNFYPMFTQKVLRRAAGGKLRIDKPYASGDLVQRLGRLYFARYGTALFVAETASQGSVRRRQDWLDASVASVKNLREEAIPMVGYTWWPMFDLVAWAYRQGERDPAAYLGRMGLWDLDSQSLDRTETPLVRSYQDYVSRGAGAVGYLRAVTR